MKKPDASLADAVGVAGRVALPDVVAVQLDHVRPVRPLLSSARAARSLADGRRRGARHAQVHQLTCEVAEMNQKLVTLTKQSNAEQMTALTAAIEEQKSSTEKRFQQLDRKLDGQEQETRQLDAGLQGVRQQIQTRDSAMSDSQRSTDVGDSSSVQKRPQRSSTLGSRKRRDDDVVLQGGGPNSTYVVHAGHEMVGKDIEIYWGSGTDIVGISNEVLELTPARLRYRPMASCFLWCATK